LLRTDTSAALRIARHAKWQGGRFPRFADDDVVQFCVEEALVTALELQEAAVVLAAEEAKPAVDAVSRSMSRRQKVLEATG
jgi:hypothetical protein